MSNNLKNKKRIIYVDPNNVNGEINGIPLTPDYTDYCISFNLVVEKSSRYNIGDVSTKKYVISWTSYIDENNNSNFTPGNYVSFLQGENVDNFNFLTTYYTDINYDDVKSKSIVEGLGVESVDISFDSYYVPTVVIKFVDVRGSSLFGREESIHNGTTLTSDNIFGCFFSLPYPLFRLQVKGFYGKPVTYQLTCSGFKGSFNAQTGNFEAIATFIGYSYSLLTDIPFQYIVAAPYSNYIGAEYWNKKVNSPEWELANGEKMVKLFQLMNEINEATIKGINEECITDNESEEKKSLFNEKKLLNDILNCYNSFINEFSKVGDRSLISSDDDCQLLIMKEDYDNNIVVGSKLSQIHTSLLNYINQYNTSYRSTSFNEDDYPNESFSPLSEGTELLFIQIFNINNEGIFPKKKLSEIKFRDNSYFNYDLTQQIEHIISTNNKNKLCQYGYLLDLNNLKSNIKKRLLRIEERSKEIEETVNRRFVNSLKQNISVTPSIGNIVKIIMAHLETFIHMVCECGRIIKNQHRTPEQLGFDMKNSDFLNNEIETVPPFPAIYNNGKKEEVGDINESIDTFAWIGDISHNFEEEKLILGLQSAAQHIKKVDNKTVFNDNNLSTLPIMPCDYYQYDIFRNFDNIDISSLSGILGIRFSQLFGVLHKDKQNNSSPLSTELAELYGKMDSYSYFSHFYNTNLIKTNIFDNTNRNGLINALTNCILCNESGDIYGNYYKQSGKTRQVFETKVKIKDEYNSQYRHPILYKDNDSYKYCYLYLEDTKDFLVLPSELLNFNKYDIHNQINKLIYNDCDRNLLRITQQDINTYINDNMFNVILSNNDIKRYMNVYNIYKKGSIVIKGKDYNEDFSLYLDKIWKVDDKDYKKYFYEDKTILFLSNKKNNISEEDLYPRYEGENPPRSLVFKDCFEINNNLIYNEDGLWKNSQGTYNTYDLFVQGLNIRTDNTDISIFGDDFYYLQNNNTDENDNGRTEDLINKSKCLLFLHTLPYNFKNIPYFNDLKNKCNGSIQAMPYGYLLLLGGLLWRWRFEENEKKKDEKDRIPTIIFSDGEQCDYKSTENNEYTLFYNDGKHYILNKFQKNSNKSYNVHLSEIFGGTVDNWCPDVHIVNKLISIFEDFVRTKWFTITSSLELRQIKWNTATNSIYTLYYTSKTFLNDVEAFRNDIYKQKITASKMIYKLNNNYFGNFFTNYRYIYVDEYNVKGLKLFLDEQNDVQSILREVFASKKLVFDNNAYINYYKKQYERNIIIREGLLNSYLKGFTNNLEKLINNNIGTDNNPNASENTIVQRDLVLPMYMYIKNLWDKWLVNKDESTYYVENFFKDFVFIDSFYRNMYKLLMINLNKLRDSYENRAKDGSIYQVLGDIASDHRCLFLSMPDYICLGDDDINVAVENMKDLFRPIPYNSAEGISRNNKFIFIYTHKPVDSGNELNEYSINSYDIWDERTHDLTPIAYKIFGASTTNTSTDQINRYGYNVPSFGVTFSRQDNNLFKNIKLDMNNPIDTEQAIIVMNDIARLGAGNNHKIAYMGQDTYPIFSNYSYMCEIEMMGNAQIMPLMYFQLMNIPMWRGTYMIYQVNHKLTPGNMTTTFRGMKMSCKATPYNTQWFTYVSPIIDGYTNYKEEAIDNVVKPVEQKNILEPEYNKSDNSLWNLEEDLGPFGSKLCRGCLYGIKDNTYKGVSVNRKLILLFNKLYNDIEIMNNNITDPKHTKWNICLSHVLRASNGNKRSHHMTGNAMDLKVMRFDKNGNVKYCMAGEYQRELTIVFDIISKNYIEDVSEVFLEYKNTNDFNSKPYNFNVLHIASSDAEQGKDFRLCDLNGVKVNNSTNSNYKINEYNNNNFINYIEKNLPEFKTSAAKYFEFCKNNNDIQKFTNTFTNFKSISYSIMAEYFSREKDVIIIPLRPIEQN